MGKVSDFLSDEQKKAYIISNLIPGKILRLYCTFTNPPKEKYFVLAYSNLNSLLFIINSNVHEYIKQRKYLLHCQDEITASDYPFLKHDSYINCAKVIKHFDRQLIEEQLLDDLNRIKGELKPDTRNEIIRAVDNAKTISPKHKELIMNALK